MLVRVALLFKLVPGLPKQSCTATSAASASKLLCTERVFFFCLAAVQGLCFLAAVPSFPSGWAGLGERFVSSPNGCMFAEMLPTLWTVVAPLLLPWLPGTGR
jgi:hypothetical protein